MRKSPTHKTTCLLMFICLFLSALSSCTQSADTTPSPGTANPDITYEISGMMVDIKGFDASAITWIPPQKLGQRTIPGQLYFANPVFLGSCFQGKTSEGSAQWADDSKSSVTVSFTQNSNQNDGGAIAGPTISFTIDLSSSSISAQKSTSYEGESISLSEKEMSQIGTTLASIIQGAESYCSEN